MKKRMVSFLCLMMIMFGVVVVNLAKITAEKTFEEASAVQSRKTIELYETRAGIFDRNLVPLVNKSRKRMLLLFPDILDISSVNSFLDRDGLAEVLEKNMPSAVDIGGKIVEGEGIFNFSYPVRYGEKTPAPHIVGYISGGKGVYGIEKSFDDFLSENGEKSSVTYYTDGTGRLFSGEDIILSEEKVFEKSGVMLTIDSDIQSAAEKALSEGTEKGAAVVMDVHSGEILASVSVPEFDPANIADYLDDENSPFINRAFSAYSVGSTWKAAVAAAAIESGVSVERTFECKGHIEVDGRIFRCHWENGHGEIDMKRALEISCNPYFIDLALEIGGEKILETAKNLGFGNPSDFGEGFSSSGGNLPSEESLSSKTVLSSFAFGQGELMATPVQIAVLFSAIANGGRAVTPKIVLGTFDRKGDFSETPDYVENCVISERTAEILRGMMISVVENGSGENAKPKNGSAGGKTASAQTGQFDSAGNEIIHAWFAGFYPAENPKFAVVVFAEGMDSGGDFAAPIFRKICDSININNY